MYECVDKYEVAGCRVLVFLNTGGSVGGEYSLSVQGNGWVVARTFYFEDANERHMRNFVRKVATDENYRKACTWGTSDWSRVSGLYEEASYRIFDIFEKRGLLGYMAGNKRQKRQSDEATAILERLCRQLYRKLKEQVAKNEDSHRLVDEIMEKAQKHVLRFVGGEV